MYKRIILAVDLADAHGDAQRVGRGVGAGQSVGRLLAAGQRPAVVPATFMGIRSADFDAEQTSGPTESLTEMAAESTCRPTARASRARRRASITTLLEEASDWTRT